MIKDFLVWLEDRNASSAASDILAKQNWPSSIHQLRRDRNNDVYTVDDNDEDLRQSMLNRPLYKQEPETPEPETPPAYNPRAAHDQWSKDKAWPPSSDDVGKVEVPKGARSNVYTRFKNPNLKGDAITPELATKIKELAAQGYTAMGITLTLADDGNHKLNYKDVMNVMNQD